MTVFPNRKDKIKCVESILFKKMLSAPRIGWMLSQQLLSLTEIQSDGVVVCWMRAK